MTTPSNDNKQDLKKPTDTNGFESNPYIQDPNEDSTFNSNTVPSDIANGIIDDIPSDSISEKRKPKFSFKNLFAKKPRKSSEVEEISTDPIASDESLNSSSKKKKFDKELFKTVSINLIRVLAIVILLLSIIRVPYFGAFIDAVIFGFIFGWARYFVYGILLIALVLLWFPKYYRKVFSKKKWLMYLAIAFAFSIILSGIGTYVMNLNGLGSFTQFFINKNGGNVNHSFISSWYENLWLDDIVKYNHSFLNDASLINGNKVLDYAHTISPSHYEYGGLFGIFWVAVFIFAAPALLIVIGVIIVVVALSFIIAKKKRNQKTLSPLRIKLIQLLGGYTEKQENSDIQKYDVSEMKFSSSIHKKFDELTSKNSSTNVKEENDESISFNGAPVIKEDIVEETISIKSDTVPNIISTKNIEVTAEMSKDFNSAKLITKENEVDSLEEETEEPSKQYKLLQLKDDQAKHDEHFNSAFKYEKNLKNLPKVHYPKLNLDSDITQDDYSLLTSDLSILKAQLDIILGDKEIQYSFIDSEIMYQTVSVSVKFNEIPTPESIDEIYSILNSKEEYSKNKVWVSKINDYVYKFIAKLSRISIIGLNDLMAFVAYKNPPMSMVVGKEADRSEFYINGIFEPRVVVYGGSGSGRMMLISSMLVSLCYFNSPRELQGYIIDINGKSLKHLHDLPHLVINPVTEIDEALNLLENIVNKDIEENNKKFEALNVDNIYDYNNKVGAAESISNTFIVINDFNELIEANEPKANFLINTLLSEAYNHGIIIVMTTRIIDSNTTRYNSSMDNIIAMKLDSVNESYSILEESGAEYLAGNGDLLLRTAQGIFHLQMPFANREQTATLVNQITEAFKK